MRPQYYRQYSFDCLQLANTTSNPETKAVLVDMAQAWLRLADQARSFRRKNYGHLTLVSDTTQQTA
jgi:hypothetical protein